MAAWCICREGRRRETRVLKGQVVTVGIKGKRERAGGRAQSLLAVTEGGWELVAGATMAVVACLWLSTRQLERHDT